VQITDANGVVSFTSIFPGCYSGRWPHIHFEVFEPGGRHQRQNKKATRNSPCPRTHAIVRPPAASQRGMSQTVKSDNVFSGNVHADTHHERPRVTAKLNVGV
jgi:protocatechuate 3,4-dioxygenase beta subunit